MTGKAAALAIVFALAAGIAQVNGSVSGTVSDPTGAVIVGASVELTNTQTNLKRQTTTDSAGRYQFNALPAGQYELSVRSPGFKNFTRKALAVGSTPVTVNVTLEAGSVSESVEVTAVARLSGGLNASFGQARAPARGIRDRRFKFNTEQYDNWKENEFLPAKGNPLSTFSADVDTASYSNVRRFLNEGRLPPPDAVRIEELLNYFSYDYPDPAGKEPFSVTTGVAGCPWKPDHKLVHIGLRTKSVDMSRLPRANLVFLLDVSGSMQAPNKLPLVKSSIRLLAEQPREQDSVAIAVYAGAAGMALAPTPGSEKARIVEAIESLHAGGSTNGAEGIRLAYRLARESFVTGGINRVILATDGDFNVGVSSDGELVRMIEAEREAGVFLSVLGFGMGNVKDSKMEKLADHGNGNYAYVDNLREARKVLVEQMSGTLLTVAKDVKLQVEFNPERVKAYRLIGYENRVLRPEEFNDDKKDAGDMGAGTSVTALYEVIPAGSSEKVPGVDELRYQRGDARTAAAASKELAMIKFRYKPPSEDKSELFTQVVLDSDRSFADAGREMRFAAAVAEYGLILRQSQFAKGASLEHARSAAEQARGEDRSGYRAEFIELIKAAQRLAHSGGGVE
jgi:Ca-activated chloride channel homolog